MTDNRDRLIQQFKERRSTIRDLEEQQEVTKGLLIALDLAALNNKLRELFGNCNEIIVNEDIQTQLQNVDRFGAPIQAKLGLVFPIISADGVNVKVHYGAWGWNSTGICRIKSVLKSLNPEQVFSNELIQSLRSEHIQTVLGYEIDWSEYDKVTQS